MQIRIAALADYTNITENKKLNILGIFSQIYAISTPAVHPQMQLVVQFAFYPAETGEKNIRIILQDLDANPILSLDGKANIPHPEGPDPVVVNQVIALQNVVFPKYGSYEFVIEVDGEPMSVRVPVDLIPISPAQGNEV